MADTKQVRAIDLGFYQGRMIKRGTVFQVPSTFKAKWVVDASAPAPTEEPKARREEPTTLSEIGRANVGRLPVGVAAPEPLAVGPRDTIHEDRPEGGNTEEPAGDIVPPMPDPKTTPHEDRPEGGDVEPPASLAKVKGKAKA